MLEYSSIFIAGVTLLVLRLCQNSGPNLDAIPTYGYSNRFLSYITAFRFLQDSHKVIDGAYQKYKGNIFKIPMVDHWMVVVSDITSVEDIRGAPDNVLSFDQALHIFLQTRYTVGPQLLHDRYHTDIIRTTLTHNLAALTRDIQDELSTAFEDAIPYSREWIKYPALETIMSIVCRTSNRIFVGVPTCRNTKYQELNLQFTLEVVKAAVAIKIFPEFLKPLAALIFSNVRTCTRQCIEHIKPIVEERRAMQQELGDHWEKPNDLLMWCMDTAQTDEQDIEKIATRILLVNFGAIHTTSMAFTFALYRLAESPPQIVDALRKDVDSALATHGWSKAALSGMRKVDSFLRECLRIDTPGVWAMQRLSLQSFTFSNGCTIPPGTMIACPVIPLHTDDQFYPNSHEFDAFRFSDMREADGEGHKNQLVSTKADYIAFGHGKHACPGRFFAANELKLLLAHVLQRFDIKFEDGKSRPANIFLGPACMPGKSDLLFRERQS